MRRQIGVLLRGETTPRGSAAVAAGAEDGVGVDAADEVVRPSRRGDAVLVEAGRNGQRHVLDLVRQRPAGNRRRARDREVDRELFPFIGMRTAASDGSGTALNLEMLLAVRRRAAWSRIALRLVQRQRRLPRLCQIR